MAEVSYLIPEPKTEIGSATYLGTLLITQNASQYACKKRTDTEKWWAIGMIANNGTWWHPCIVSNVEKYSYSYSDEYWEDNSPLSNVTGSFEYNGTTFYVSFGAFGSSSSTPTSATIPIYTETTLPNITEAGKKLIDLYKAAGGTMPGKKEEYSTSWVRKLIDGVWQKTFTFAHAKTVYTDFANKKTLADKLSEIDISLDGKANSTHTHTKSQITDFPTLGTASTKDVASTGNASTSQVVMGNDTRLNDARQASDVSAWAKASVKPSYSKSEVGLGNVDNTSDINKPVSTVQQTAIDTAYANANKYTDKKVADLVGSAPETMDTLEEVAAAIQENKDVETALNAAIGTKANQTELDTHTGNSTIHITASERTKWNAAKTHADSTHARTDATKVEKSSTNGNIKINGTETTVYTHPSGTNPHGTTKSDVGLGNVGNFKAVSTVANQDLTDTEKSNARANIGAGTSSFSGSYNDLSNKPTIPTNNNQLTNGAGYITSSGTAKTISDTLPISKGGTGKTNGADAANALINSLSEGNSTPTDTDYYISQYVSGGTTTTTYHRRPMSALWNYIKSKLATVATSGSYSDLSNKPTIPSVGNGTITIKQAGKSKGTFTMNQSGNTTIELTDTDTNTWRPLGTTADTACAGNDSRLSNARPASDVYAWAKASGKPSYSWSEITSKPSTFTPSSHTHNYAGSSSSGGSATSAVKLDSSAGSATQPVYFSGGKPVACTYSLNKTVPSNAVFTDTNTWRGIQNNLTSDSTTDSLSAAQGKVLKGLVDGKASSNHTHSYLPLSGGTVTGETQFNNYLKLNAWSGYGTGTANFWYDANNKFVEIQNATDLKLAGTKVSKEGHTHSYVPLNTNSTVNGAITFGKNDSYGIFTSTNNYCSIGSSSAYFYRAYINNIYLENLSFKKVNANLNDNTRKSIFRSGFKDEVIQGCAPNSSGIIDLGAKCTALNSTNGGGHHVVCCFMANSNESLVGRAVAYRGNGCNWYCRLTDATDDSPAAGWSSVSIFVLYTNW